VRVLITGGSGYIGSHVVRAFLLRGHSVVVIDDLSTGDYRLIERLNAQFIEGDAGDFDLLDALFREHKFDAVVHIAGRSIVPESVSDPAPYWRANFMVGSTILEVMRKHGVKRFVFSSTGSVYGVPSTSPISELVFENPTSPYGASKRCFELLLESYISAYGLDALALRYFNVVGASHDALLGEIHDPETHVVPNLIKNTIKGDPFVLFGVDHPTRDGTAERDYVHVEDLAEAHVTTVESLGSPKLDGIFAMNLGTGRGTTVKELLAAVEKTLELKVEVVEQPARPGDPPSLVADPSLAERTLGIRCERSIESAILSAHAFWMSEGM